MKVTSYDLYDMGIADEILKEPNGSAHIDPLGASQILRETIVRNYIDLKKNSVEELINMRLNKYDKIGEYERR